MTLYVASVCFGQNNFHSPVSLPAAPFDLPKADRAATEPSRRRITIAGAPDMLRYDPLLRHADTRRDRR